MQSKGGLQTCVGCDSPLDCSECALKDVDEWCFDVLRIFNRCRNWEKLPYPGGVRQQPEWLMKCFDVIALEYRKWETAQLHKSGGSRGSKIGSSRSKRSKRFKKRL